MTALFLLFFFSLSPISIVRCGAYVALLFKWSRSIACKLKHIDYNSLSLRYYTVSSFNGCDEQMETNGKILNIIIIYRWCESIVKNYVSFQRKSIFVQEHSTWKWRYVETWKIFIAWNSIFDVQVHLSYSFQKSNNKSALKPLIKGKQIRHRN